MRAGIITRENKEKQTKSLKPHMCTVPLGSGAANEKRKKKRNVAYCGLTCPFFVLFVALIVVDSHTVFNI